MKKLFTIGCLPLLENLEEIRVGGCEEMEEIISKKPEREEEQGMGDSNNHYIVNNKHSITLPKLKSLYLWHLPELKSIVYDRMVMHCDYLRSILVLGCPRLKRLPFFMPMFEGKPSAPPVLRNINVNKGSGNR
ncbi:hypothetical protein L1049_000567 [Liquidambar formosana]|uniref:Disease resistance protein At4g27190-like leucine-rich repeats domain-containing protein n=1 Tax=Liquidambar formosana TaxID=63359 RepID=A0AAP0N908_LIQFO